MTRSRIRATRKRSGISSLATAVALGWAACFANGAAAQDSAGLRGAIATEDEGISTLPSARPRFVARSTATPQTTPAPRYRPVSEGALPDEPRETELDGYVEPNAGAIPTNDLTAARMVRRRSTERSTADEEEPRRTSSRQTTAMDPSDETATAEDPLTTGTVRADSIVADDEERNTAAEVTAERVGAIEAIPSEQEEDPYAAPGIRVGTFLLRPTLSQGIEWTSNNQSTAGGSSDFLSSTNLNIEAASQWSRHSASLSLDGTYRTSITGTGYSEFTGSADAAGVLDVRNDYRINAGAGYSRGPEEATSPTVLSGTASRALRQTLTGTLGAEKYAGKLRAAITGQVARNIYGDATLSSGGTLSQADRNNTLYSAKLRGGYEISPALVPFVELEYGRRLYDRRLDGSGYARSANILGARGGVEFDLGEKLNGEVSAGWLSESIDDARLASISALSLDAEVNWSPIRGTTVALNAGTEIEGTTSAGSSGSVLYDASVSVTRQMRANLTGTATVGAGWRRYAASTDRDLTLNGEVSLTWWLNRFAGITGKASHERVSSNVAGRGSQTSTVFLGLTLRR